MDKKEDCKKLSALITLIIISLEKIGIGIGLFLCAYLANIGLGAWKNVKIEGGSFDWKLISQSIAKFVVLGLSLTLLSTVVSVIPAYATYIGIEIGAETMETIDSLVIISGFLMATIKYIADALEKLKVILGN